MQYNIQDLFKFERHLERRFFFYIFLASSSVLLSTGPIYWLPGIPLPIMTSVKSVAFFLTVGFAFLAARKVFIPVRLTFLFIGAASLNFLASILNGHEQHAFYQAFIFLAPMVLVLTIRSLSCAQGASLLKHLSWPLGVVTCAVIYAFLARFGVFPDLSPPSQGLQLIDRQWSGFERMTVSSVGFNFGRTGWGTGTSMALVLLGAILISRKKRVLGLTILALAVLAPAAMGGRGAALSAAAAFCFAIIALRGLGNLRIILVFLICVIPVVGIERFVYSGLLSDRFFNFDSGVDLFTALDQLSTGRLTTWVHALDNFVASPIYGVGPTESRVILHTGQVVAVHNVWLAFLSEGGIMAFLPAILLFLTCARLIWRISEFRPVLVFAFSVSLVEPNVVFGTFGNQLPFWFAVGLAATSNRALRQRSSLSGETAIMRDERQR